jgi:pseudouridine synthase
MRLEKFLAESGIASRRSAKKYIQAGQVTVNGECVLVPGTHIDPWKDLIEVDGKRTEGEPKKVYLMLNKPGGYLTTRRDEWGRPTVMELVCDIPERIYPVGRLDCETEGLLLMTNDGAFSHRLTHPSHEVEKTYIARVEGQPSQRAIQQLRGGVEIESGLTAPATVIQIGRKGRFTAFKVTIHEGQKRQIRRMFRAVGHKVVYLKRVRIGSLSLGNLPPGKCRMLTPAEIEALQKQ